MFRGSRERISGRGPSPSTSLSVQRRRGAAAEQHDGPARGAESAAVRGAAVERTRRRRVRGAVAGAVAKSRRRRRRPRRRVAVVVVAPVRGEAPDDAVERRFFGILRASVRRDPGRRAPQRRPPGVARARFDPGAAGVAPSESIRGRRRRASSSTRQRAVQPVHAFVGVVAFIPSRAETAAGARARGAPPRQREPDDRIRSAGEECGERRREVERRRRRKRRRVLSHTGSHTTPLAW